MNQQEIARLNDEEKAAYSAMEHLFDSSGWASYMGWVQSKFDEATELALNADEWADNRLATGARVALDTILSFEQESRAVFAALVESRIEEEEIEELDVELDFE